MAAVKRTEKPHLLVITRKLAQYMQGLNKLARDRPLDIPKGLRYRRQMLAGEFRYVDWAVAYCKETGLTYRVNGNTTSFAAADLPVNNQDQVLPKQIAAFQEYDCDTLQEVVELWQQFDKADIGRNYADINMSYAGLIPALSNLAVSRQVVNLTVKGISYAKMDALGLKPGSQAERAQALIGEDAFCAWFVKFLKGGNRNLFTRGPVAAVMFETWKLNSVEAEKFWAEVRDASHPNNKAPSRNLHTFLTEKRIQAATSRVAKADVISTEEFYIRCKWEWNDFREQAKKNGRVRTSKRIFKKNSPVPALIA